MRIGCGGGGGGVVRIGSGHEMVRFGGMYVVW